MVQPVRNPNAAPPALRDRSEAEARNQIAVELAATAPRHHSVQLSQEEPSSSRDINLGAHFNIPLSSDLTSISIGAPATPPVAHVDTAVIPQFSTLNNEFMFSAAELICVTRHASPDSEYVCATT